MEFIFTLRQICSAKTGAAGLFLLALKNELIIWAYLNIACQSCKNLINVKIVQYVNKSEFILNLSFDMCIFYSDIEQFNIYNEFVTFISFPHDALTRFVSE